MCQWAYQLKRGETASGPWLAYRWPDEIIGLMGLVSSTGAFYSRGRTGYGIRWVAEDIYGQGLLRRVCALMPSASRETERGGGERVMAAHHGIHSAYEMDRVIASFQRWQGPCSMNARISDDSRI